jgi:hypothetical protein
MGAGAAGAADPDEGIITIVPADQAHTRTI